MSETDYYYVITGHIGKKRLPPRRWDTWNQAARDFNGRWGYRTIWSVNKATGKRKKEAAR